MALIQTRLNKVGNLIKHEYAPEHLFCREPATVTGGELTAPTAAGVGTGQVGTVIIDVDSDGVWVLITETLMAAFDAATDRLAVLVDDQVEELDLTADQTLAVMVNGPAILRKGAMQIGDVTTSEALLFAAFNDEQIKFADFFSTNDTALV